VLERATNEWYTLLKPKPLPAHAGQQVTSVRVGVQARPMVKFNEPDAVLDGPTFRCASETAKEEALG
jgi:hypothetical protein